MSDFIKSIFPSKKVWVIDIWSYKIKVAICELKYGSLDIIWYWEKRQDSQDIIYGEIWNIWWVCNSIEDAFKKASSQAWVSVNDIFINIPTRSIVWSSNNVNYKRKNKNQEIDLDELDHIIWKVESYSIEKAKKKIFQDTWYRDMDLKLITSSITKILIDNNKVSNPIWFTWEYVNISTINIFTPLSKYQLIQTIWNFLWKKVNSIIPMEFSIPKIFEKAWVIFDDIIYLDIWSHRSRIIVQKSWIIHWFNMMDIWINDLIKLISSVSELTSSQIIERLDDKDFYLNEKNIFFDTWLSWFLIILREILIDEVVPHNIIVIWWWNNIFLRDMIKSIDFSKHSLKSLKSIELLDNNKVLDNIFSENDFFNFDNTNIWIASMILAWSEILNLKKDPVVDILKKIIKKIDNI